jgi:hypothetical protein
MALYVLCSPQPTAEDTCLTKLAQFLGLKIQPLSGPADDESTDDTAIHIATTYRSLERFQKQPLGKAWLSRRLATKGSSLFLTGIDGSSECLQTIGTIAPGIVESVFPVSGRRSAYAIARGASCGMHQFAGLTFGAADAETAGVFRLRRDADNVATIVAIDGCPCYLKVDRAGASYFLLACSRVLDIDSAAEQGQQLIARFLSFVPFLAYLRVTFGACCWRNPDPTACFIIDDPLLRERYGFLDLNRLESSMTRSRFSANIAFIPWNCRRTDRRVAEKFKRADRRLSISIHGCDHTEGEFGVTDECWLRSQSHLALSRMAAHETLTGVKHNRVMVFPQGVFSKASLKALGDEGFLAAVNSTIYPVDAVAGEITFRDLMEVAVVRFGGVPLFLRHYAGSLEKVALDLLLGRQVLIVEHHGFFKEGYEEIERFTAFVNEIAPEIRWTDLEELCTSACLMREVPGEGVHVRAFGFSPRLRNRRGERTRFQVSIAWQDALDSVRWNGQPIAFEFRPTGAVCDVLLDAGQAGLLSFRRAADGAHVTALATTTQARAKVIVRRFLCEVRDNYLDRSRILSALTRHGKRLLPRL